MNSGFRGYNPYVNMLFFISVIVYGMLIRHPVYLALSLFGAFIYYLRLKGKAGIKTFLCFILPMFRFVVLINSFSNHYGVTALFTLPSGNKFTFESLMTATATSLIVVIVMLWFFCYNEVVTADKFMHVFGKILPVGALVISMALRFVPMYRKQFSDTYNAQKCFGEANGKNGYVNRIRCFVRVSAATVSHALENAIQTADSMKARGYGLRGRTSYSRFKWTSRDTVVISLLILLNSAVIFGVTSGCTYCIYNPYVVINPSANFGTTFFIEDLNMTLNPFSAAGIISMIAYFFLCFMPVMIDVKEDIRWNRLKSKI